MYNYRHKIFVCVCLKLLYTEQHVHMSLLMEHSEESLGFMGKFEESRKTIFYFHYQQGHPTVGSPPPIAQSRFVPARTAWV